MKIRFSINEPCSASWNEMHPNSEGRHCDQCQKTVHDFTSMNADQIAERMINSNRSICGRINTSDLHKSFVVHTAGVSGKMAAGSLIAAALIAGSVPVNEEQTKSESEAIVITSNKTKTNQLILSGTLRDSSGKPVPNAFLNLYSGDQIIGTAQSISNGRFKISVDKNRITGELRIEAGADQFESFTQQIQTEQAEDLNIVLQQKTLPDVQILNTELNEIKMNDIFTNEVYVTAGAMVMIVEPEYEEIIPLSADTIEEKIETFNIKEEEITPEFIDLKIYPNPSSDFTTIEMSQEGNYNIYVISNDGKIVENHSTSSNKFTLDIQSYPKGIYYLNVTESNGKTVKTGKFIKA